MISIRYVRQFCSDDISEIENYEKAVSDKENIWDCHHSGEILPCGIFSREKLKTYGLYYNRPASELIFLTRREHHRLHTTGDNHPLYGKHHSAETKRKMSEALKGRQSPNKGKHHTGETKQKISESNKGKHHSAEAKRRMSLARKAYYTKKKMIENKESSL